MDVECLGIPSLAMYMTSSQLNIAQVPGLTKLAAALHSSFQDWWSHFDELGRMLERLERTAFRMLELLGCWDFPSHSSTPIVIIHF